MLECVPPILKCHPNFWVCPSNVGVFPSTESVCPMLESPFPNVWVCPSNVGVFSPICNVSSKILECVLPNVRVVPWMLECRGPERLDPLHLGRKPASHSQSHPKQGWAESSIDTSVHTSLRVLLLSTTPTTMSGFPPSPSAGGFAIYWLPHSTCHLPPATCHLKYGFIQNFCELLLSVQINFSHDTNTGKYVWSKF